MNKLLKKEDIADLRKKNDTKKIQSMVEEAYKKLYENRKLFAYKNIKLYALKHFYKNKLSKDNPFKGEIDKGEPYQFVRHSSVNTDNINSKEGMFDRIINYYYFLKPYKEEIIAYIKEHINELPEETNQMLNECLDNSTENNITGDLLEKIIMNMREKILGKKLNDKDVDNYKKNIDKITTNCKLLNPPKKKKSKNKRPKLLLQDLYNKYNIITELCK